MSGEFAVIGLGQFGRAVALSLVREGAAVLAIDQLEERAQLVESEVDAVACADATDERALNELGLERMSCVVVAMGARARETSILTTSLLRQRGIPRIISRAANELHARVLLAVGAHEVINPELQMGQRLARNLAHPTILEQIALDENTNLVEVATPEQFIGKSMNEIDMKRRYGVSVIAIRRGGQVLPQVAGDERLARGDRLLIVGQPASVRRVASLA
ncbi:trk system potassium uptake protein TrkA [Nannocystis exedens]|uniref:Trk system potassium uptake protein TrkA n=1 Tax=Nannocystis exedens TaxID=54 RepID=A0A1I1T9B4_9BACT|nr:MULTISPECIES: TrkA family potassium uptake protein [Nannocystis]MCY0986109.1 TrkA family potassium uptake protein [Nannocystis sp. ILAH1]MCY1068705.1 TrkA family potassium uptake protein [Nannocystis sp. RBIL2]PCC66701.1 potassium uptake system protein [Nannocystis exedens]SFD55192.1 trk system potassium uptake protein TrkA [Nannocystis exedens]